MVNEQAHSTPGSGPEAAVEERLDAQVPGGTLRVRRRGPAGGQRVLFLHGGPGLSDSYLDDLLDEFADKCQVATYAQRGVAQSTAAEPFDLAVQAADVAAVIDALDWRDAIVVGHSWGGHLLFHVLAEHVDRISAAVAIDALGAVGDGESEAFGAEIAARLSPEARARSEQPDLSDDEQFALNWPGYFPPGIAVPPVPTIAFHPDVFESGVRAAFAVLPDLADRLREVTTPVLFVIGEGSPMPEAASVHTAARLMNTTTVRIPGGHFPWLVSPGATRAAVDAFLSNLPRAIP